MNNKKILSIALGALTIAGVIGFNVTHLKEGTPKRAVLNRIDGLTPALRYLKTDVSAANNYKSSDSKCMQHQHSVELRKNAKENEIVYAEYSEFNFKSVSSNYFKEQLDKEEDYIYKKVDSIKKLKALQDKVIVNRINRNCTLIQVHVNNNYYNYFIFNDRANKSVLQLITKSTSHMVGKKKILELKDFLYSQKGNKDGKDK